MAFRSSGSRIQFLRYVAVGGFNTLFSYGVFAFLNWLMSGFGEYSYMYAAIVSNFIVISVAFLGYKWFVFRTRGNYLMEWIRCFAVYGVSALIGIAFLPVLVTLLKHSLRRPELASYLAAALITCISVVISFLGHKNVSFRERRTEQE
ncbi:MAG: GtrA family protein [Terracidiphilus sp.]|nr:GtrA family protein [Terracidiphilus sp.]